MGLFEDIRALVRGERKALQVVPTWQVGQEQFPTQNYTSLSKDGYKTNEIVYSCVRHLATSIAEPKVRVLTGLDAQTGQEIEAPPEHPLRVLLKNPNPEQTYFDLAEATMTMLAICGNAYWEKERAAIGQSVSLWPMRPDRVSVIPGPGGILAYRYKVGDYQRDIPAENVLHFKWHDPINDFYGVGPLQVAAQVADADIERTRFMRAFFANAGVPYGLLATKVKLEKAEALRIKREWKEQYGGMQGWSNIAVLDADAAYIPMGFNMVDIAFPELTQLSEARICMCFGVPPILIGASVGLEQSTYSNYEQARKAFWEDTMAPIVRKMEDVLNLAFGEEFGAEIDLDLRDVKALQEDRSAKWERADVGLKDGWVTVNEARLEAGLTTIDGQDVFIRPFGSVVINAETGQVEQTFEPLSPFGGNDDQGADNQGSERPRANNDDDNRNQRRAFIAQVKYHLAQQHKAYRKKDDMLQNEMHSAVWDASFQYPFTMHERHLMMKIVDSSIAHDWPWTRLEQYLVANTTMGKDDGSKKVCTCPSCTKAKQEAVGPLGRIADFYQAKGAKLMARYFRSEQELVQQIIAEEYHAPGKMNVVTNFPRLNDRLSRVSRAGALVLASSMQPVIEETINAGACYTWARVAKYRLEEKLKEYKGFKGAQPNLKPRDPTDLSEAPQGVKPVGVYYVTPEDMANSIVAMPVNTQELVTKEIEKAVREGWSEQDLQLRVSDMYRGWCEWRSEHNILGFGSNAVNRASRDAGQDLEHSELVWLANNDACPECQALARQRYTVPEDFTTGRFDALVSAISGQAHTRKPTREEEEADKAVVHKLYKVEDWEEGATVPVKPPPSLEEWEREQNEQAERDAALEYRGYKAFKPDDEWDKAFKLIDRLEPTQSVAPSFLVRVDMPKKWDAALGMRQLVPIGAERSVKLRHALMHTKAGEAGGDMNGPRAAIVFDIPGEPQEEHVHGDELTDYALLGESCHWTPPLHDNCRCELEVRVGPYEGEAWAINPEDSITFIEDEEAWIQNYIQEQQKAQEEKLSQELEERIQRETEEWYATHASPEEISRRAAEEAARDWEAFLETLPEEGWSIPWLGAPPYTDEQLEEALRDEKEQIAREARQRVKDEIEADALAWKKQQDYPSLEELGRQAQANAAQEWEEEKLRLKREQYLVLMEQLRHVDEELERLRKP